MKKGNAKSIRAILKNIADKESIDFQLLIIRYLHERLLYRIANSKYANNFILKGGALLYAIEGLHIRPTVDIDMLAKRINNDEGQIKQIFRTICDVKYDDDCVIFNINSLETADISKDEKHSCIRIFVESQFDTIRQRLQIDIGFGDVITPEPVLISYPTLLDELSSPKIMAYSIETIIAEKFEAMIALSILNSRMKDFYDVYTLLNNNKIENYNLRSAIFQTFIQRDTNFTENHPLFSESFYEDKYRQTMWKAFLRKIGYPDDLDFSIVVKSIVERLYPIYYELKNNKFSFEK